MYLLKIILRTTVLVVLLSAIYFVFFLLPKLIFQKELTKAEKSIYAKYYQLSQNRMFQTQYISLKSSSLSFSGEKDMLLGKIDESIKLLETSSDTLYRKSIFTVTSRSNNINLKFVESNDKELSGKIKDIAAKEKVEVEKLKKINSALSNLYLYDMGIDFYGLDVTSDSDRETIVKQLDAASEGLSKVTEKLTALNQAEKLGEEFDKISKDIKEFSDKFKTMRGYVDNANYQAYTKYFRDSIKEYENLRSDCFKLEQDLFKSSNYLQILTEEKQVMQKYEELLEKINNMQSVK